MATDETKTSSGLRYRLLTGVGVLILAFFGTKFVLEYVFHYNA